LSHPRLDGIHFTRPSIGWNRRGGDGRELASDSAGHIVDLRDVVPVDADGVGGGDVGDVVPELIAALDVHRPVREDDERPGLPGHGEQACAAGTGCASNGVAFESGGDGAAAARDGNSSPTSPGNTSYDGMLLQSISSAFAVSTSGM